ncbi:MAG: sensor histidine kinase [Acidobacteriota bacterium]
MRLIATIQLVSEALESAVEPDTAAWAALVGLTAGEGLGLNRAFLLLAQGDDIRGWFGVGPASRADAAVVWAEIGNGTTGPFDRLASPDRAVVDAERARHAELLSRLSHPIVGGCPSWRRAFVARPNHPHPCVRHWVDVLESDAVLVLPMIGNDEPWGVVLADNFVTRTPIKAATVDAAQTIARTLHAALERTRLLSDLRDEQRRRVAAEHATTLLEAARALAHDLKNPLALAGGLARELQAAPPAPGEALHKQLALISAAVQRAEERLAELAEGLTTKANRVTIGPVDIVGAVERVVGSFRPLADSRGIRVELEVPDCALAASAEASLLERCVENLVGNGLHALRDTATPEPVLRVSVLARGEWVHVEVADNGPGLPEPLRTDPFSGALAGRRAGAGLGLVSVRRLADAMSARVEYDEREPGWVRFTLFLRRTP